MTAGSAPPSRPALPAQRTSARQPAGATPLAAIAALAGLTVALAFAATPAEAVRPAPPGAVPSLVEPAASAPPEARWAHLRHTTFQHWSPEEGLPHPIVTALAQDRTGFLWVGTQDGLARWDGYRFKSYHPDPSDARKAGSLSSGYIDTLGTDRAGRLWVGTDDGHVARLDEQSDRFVRVDAPAEAASATAEILAIVEDGGPGLWVGTSRGLWHVDDSGDNPDAQAKAHTVPGIPPGHGVRALLRDPQGTLWVGTEQGLWRCTNPPADLQCAAFPVAFAPARAPAASAAASAAPSSASASASGASADAPSPALSILALSRTKDGRLWIGTASAGAFVLDPASGRTTPLRESGAPSSKFPTDTVTTIAQAPTGELWMGTNGDGVFVIDPSTLGTRHVRHDPRLAPGLSSDDIYVSLVDRSGLLWLGGARGLSRTDADAGPIVTIFGQTSREDGLGEPDAPTLLAAADGRLWIGLGEHGIDILDPTRGRVDHLEIAAASGVAGQQAKSAVSSLTQATDGTVFIGTASGMFRTDATGRGITHIPWQLQGRPAVQELSFGGGKVWIGARVQGVWALDVASGAGATPVKPPGLEHLADERIVAVRWDDAQARLWIGTPTGLVVYDPASGKVENVKAIPGDPASLSGDFISCILHDSAHRTWIGTLGGGFSLVTGRDAAGRLRFRRFGAADGLPRPNIGSLQEAADGRIWASTDGGFAIIDPATMKVHAVLRADGAAITSYWINSGGRTDHDELVFGGAGGFTVVRPALYRPWSFRPPVVITETRRPGQPPDTRARGPKTGLTLQPGENALSVEFTALDYSAPERNRYAYRLAGVDAGWVDTDPTKRLATYTNLPPGDYTLQLRGSNRDGQWTEVDDALTVHVLPLWYQTWWARGFAALIALSLIYGVVRWRTRSLELRKRELLSLVAERTAELEDKQRELLRANENLALLASFDPLTRCLNRRAFLEQGEHRFFEAASNGAEVFCAMIDIDHFKNVNDRHGHPVGDAVIRGVAVALQRALRTGDLICRYGGEEFCVLLTGIDEGIACMLAERIRAKVEHEVGQGLREVPGLRVTVSVGVAARTAETSTLDPLIARADQALYAAKRGGRNRVAMGPEGRITSIGQPVAQDARGGDRVANP